MVENGTDKTTRNAAEASARAAGEMARTAAEVSRRTMESTRAAAQVTRDYLDQSADAERKLFDAWAAGTEASLRAAFELQNTALRTNLSLMEATASSSHVMAQQWTDVAHQAQQAALEAWQASITAAKKFGTATTEAGKTEAGKTERK